MERDSLIGTMETGTRVSTEWIKDMAQVRCTGLMELCMMGTGSKEHNMVMES